MVVRPDELFGQPISMVFFFFQPFTVRRLLEAAGFAIEDVIEREPHARNWSTRAGEHAFLQGSQARWPKVGRYSGVRARSLLVFLKSRSFPFVPDFRVYWRRAPAMGSSLDEVPASLGTNCVFTPFLKIT